MRSHAVLGARSLCGKEIGIGWVWQQNGCAVVTCRSCRTSQAYAAGEWSVARPPAYEPSTGPPEQSHHGLTLAQWALLARLRSADPTRRAEGCSLAGGELTLMWSNRKPARGSS